MAWTAFSSLPSSLEQDVAGAHLRRRLVLRQVLLIERRDLGLGHRDRLAHLLDVQQRVLDLALLADAIRLLRLLERRGDLGVGRP